MKKLLYPVFSVILITMALHSSAQEETCQPPYTLKALTPLEEFQLMSLPELKVPPGYPYRDLPAVVDNSVNPCMRPVFNQDGLCCGQAAGIAYAFTYEINRERNLPGNQAANQYVTHFPWNFMNGGNGWYGVSYLHSFQIVKDCGMPNVVDYGGSLSFGGPQRWMSGYTQYYSGMHNRINNAYQIQGGTPEGLQIIKNWLYDHMEGSSVGGVCNFYAQYMSATNTLPAGTPEAGKYVLTTFGGSANHAMTIVGYNDSIRWDYNSDGQYTNNIDINGDNVVNMKDWEIGGFKMVQSYGGVPNWGNQGYAYMMYKTIADNIGSGGIWNHCVHVLDVKGAYNPKLTARVILKHDWRGKIGVSIGLANNASANVPEISFVYPIFDYQASNQYMQGGATENDKTIEFGLDLSELLSYVELNQNVKLFMNVHEKDPDNQGTGQVIHFSIYDWTAGGTEYTSAQSNVPINENDTTTLTITRSFSFNRVHIVDETLPPAPVGQPYSYQLTANGGTSPYKWELDKTYGQYNTTATFPNVTAVQLSPSNNTNGWVTRAIDFPFPYFDSSYTSVTVHVDGYLMFDEQLYPYPYFIDDKVLFEITRNISPLMNQHQNIVSGSGQGLFYEGNSQYATFRWKTCIEANTSQALNYAVTLHPDGRIEYFYGTNTQLATYQWIAGISDGDNYNHQLTSISNKPSIPENYKTELTRYTYPSELMISEDGLFSGTPLTAYNAENIAFKVTDNNFISSKKILQLSSNGIVVMDSINAGGNQVIEFGEIVLQSVKLINIEDQPITNATMKIRINDPYVTVVDSTQDLGTLPVGVTMCYTNAFSWDVSSTVPDHHLIEIATEITSGQDTWENDLSHFAYAPIASVYDVIVDDENNRLDPGDTSDLVVTIANTGGAAATSVYAILSTTDPYISVNSGMVNIALLSANSSQDATFNVSVSDDALNSHVVTFVVTMTGDNNFIATDTFQLAIGMFQENFETGDFSTFAWGCEGVRDWYIDPSMAYEGSFSARSGSITHLEESVLLLDFSAQVEGDVGFWVMTSCEVDTTNHNYDYLAFFLDGAEQDRWDGQNGWEYHEFPVTEGYHRLKWVYHKDVNTNAGYDAAWIDLVSFPSPVTAGPDLTIDPSSIIITMKPGEIDYDTIYLHNGGPGELSFELDIAGTEYSRQSAVGSGQSVILRDEVPKELQQTALPNGEAPKELDPTHGSRSMAGSTMVSNSSEKVHTGKAYTWDLRTYCGSPDNEWTRDIYFEIPEGIEMTNATEFTGGSGGPLLFEGPLGNGVICHWHGEDANGWGVIHGGQTATGNITFYVHDYLSGNPAIHYEITGDIYGALPHTVIGELHIRNLGPEVEWLTADISEGTISGGITMPVVLSISTEGLADGEYHAWIMISDNHFNEQVIPVTLVVDTYLTTPGLTESPMSISAFPNPFSDKTWLKVEPRVNERVKVEILGLDGKVLESMETWSGTGQTTILWDATDVPPGFYVARITSGREVGFVKLVKWN